MKRINPIAFVFLMVTLFSCTKKDDIANDLPALGGETVQPLPLDIWIRDSLTKPYNIAIKYKWDPFELDLYRTLVPPQESQIIPALQAVKKIWIDSYIKEAGDAFFKTYSPKQFLMVGSMNYEPNGTVILGTAEGGRKVVLYAINGIDPKDSISVSGMLHVIEHEFSHILHQTVKYPAEYKQITPGGYTGTWYNFSEPAAWVSGFVTPYAKAEPDEDFAEMVSCMLLPWYSNYFGQLISYDQLLPLLPADAQQKLKAKEQIVVNYFKDTYDIDFYSLKNRTLNAMRAFTK